MGRRKIPIKPLKDERNRSVTFLKRKAGLFKKAYELATLCSVDVAVIIFGRNNKLYEFCSTDSGKMLSQYKNMMPYEKKASSDYHNDASHGEEDDEEDEEDESESIARGGHSRTASIVSAERNTPDTDLHIPEHPSKRVTRQTSKKTSSTNHRGRSSNTVSSSLAVRKPSRLKTDPSKLAGSTATPETSDTTPKRAQRASRRPTSTSVKEETSSSEIEAAPRASTETDDQVPSDSRTSSSVNGEGPDGRNFKESLTRNRPQTNEQPPQDSSRIRQRVYIDNNGKEIGTPPLFQHPVYRAVTANEPMRRPPSLSISTPSTDRHMQMQVKTKSQFTPVNTEHSSLSANLNLPMRSSTALGISYAQQSNWRQSPSGSPIVGRQMESFQDFGAYNTPGPPRHPVENISTPAGGVNSSRPKLKVQIPLGGSAGRSQTNDSRTEEAQNQGSPSYSNSTSPVVVLPPPSPSTYLTSGAPGGPGNPFAKPPLAMNPGEQTPLSSALPSRYVNDLLPSPSNIFAADWLPYSALQSAGGANGSGGPGGSTSFGHMTSAAAAAAAAANAAATTGYKHHEGHPVPPESDFLPSPLQFNTPVSTYNVSFANNNNVPVMARNAYYANNYSDGRITEYNTEMAERNGSPSNSSGSRDGGSKNPSTTRTTPEKRANSEGHGNNDNNNGGGDNRRQRGSRPTKKSRLS